jgi:iron complex outermembrane receptor protein
VYAQDIVGKQVPYVPVHTGTANAYMQHNKTRLTVQTQATSRRYITFDESQFFKGVMITNVLLESLAKIARVPVRVQGQVNNVFDALAFSVKRNALPGRNVAVNIIMSIN